MREWIIAAPHSERERLSREARIDGLLAQILLNRGISNALDVRRFLAPEFRGLLPPDQLAGAVPAARRMLAAGQAGRRIVIYGDYDVDGVTATAILWHALRQAGAQADYYIPSRLEEGYGLNGEALERIAADGGSLVVTVDCGVTAVEEAERARRLGLELIITDHHEPRSLLPDADLVVHPTACEPRCPNPNLSGAGVALKIAWAIAQESCGLQRVTPELREHLLDATALAALGLVADVVPLTGENRIIATYGLRQLHRTTNPGLRALIHVAGLEDSTIDDYHVGFRLAPRLNAIGRMGHAREAVELLTQADSGRAAEIAQQLDQRNRERQGVERGIVAQAEKMVIERQYDRDGCRGIVLASPGWHAGVIGIVAARMVDRFHRPAVLISLDNGEGQGSGRSVPNGKRGANLAHEAPTHFPLNEVLACCGEHLVSHGGHAMAAGLRIRTEHVDAFTRAFLHQAEQRLTPADLTPRLHLDDEVDLAQLTAGAVEPLRFMAPFGQGNARPLLATTTVELADEPRTMGQGKHLQFTVRQKLTRDGREDGSYRRAVAFGRGKELAELADHRRLRLAFEPVINAWGGNRKVELKVIDWQWAD